MPASPRLQAYIGEQHITSAAFECFWYIKSRYALTHIFSLSRPNRTTLSNPCPPRNLPVTLILSSSLTYSAHCHGGLPDGVEHGYCCLPMHSRISLWILLVCRPEYHTNSTTTVTTKNKAVVAEVPPTKHMLP